MTITVNSGSVAHSTQLTLHNMIKDVLAGAGYPTPIQEYTAGSPYFLVYEFTNGTGTYATTYHVFSVTNTSSFTHMVYNTWNTGTRTGTGNYASPVAQLNAFSAGNYSWLSFSGSDSKLGFGAIWSGSFLYFNHGYVKVQNKPAWFTENIATSTLMLFGNNITPTTMYWRSYASNQKAGTGVYPDTITQYNQPNVTLGLIQSPNQSGNYSLVYPVMLTQGGVAIGTSPDYLAYGPNFNAVAGDRIIVTPGTEEWRSINGGLWVRTV